jgi:hypothetical protein
VNEGNHSIRAIEVARDLLAAIQAQLDSRGMAFNDARFHLDGSDVLLGADQLNEWIQASVDEGFPFVRFYVESVEGAIARLNVAAFQDPDAQFHP